MSNLGWYQWITTCSKKVGGPKKFVTMIFVFGAGTGFSTTGLITALGVIIGAMILVGAVVFVQEAERRVPVQYAKKVVGRKMYGGQSTHIPLKLAMAGVLPIIFASYTVSSLYNVTFTDFASDTS